jgi:plasmid stabilization system protein ParE
VKLRYTLRAAAELNEVLAYIEARSPLGARRVQARIQLIINLLLQHPRADQRTSMTTANELAVRIGSRGRRVHRREREWPWRLPPKDATKRKTQIRLGGSKVTEFKSRAHQLP